MGGRWRRSIVGCMCGNLLRLALGEKKKKKKTWMFLQIEREPLPGQRESWM